MTQKPLDRRLARSVDRILRSTAGIGLVDWLAAQDSSIRDQAQRLEDITGVLVSRETVRLWLADLDERMPT